MQNEYNHFQTEQNSTLQSLITDFFSKNQLQTIEQESNFQDVTIDKLMEDYMQIFLQLQEIKSQSIIPSSNIIERNAKSNRKKLSLSMNKPNINNQLALTNSKSNKILNYNIKKNINSQNKISLQTTLNNKTLRKCKDMNFNTMKKKIKNWLITAEDSKSHPKDSRQRKFNYSQLVKNMTFRPSNMMNSIRNNTQGLYGINNENTINENSNFVNELNSDSKSRTLKFQSFISNNPNNMNININYNNNESNEKHNKTHYKFVPRSKNKDIKLIKTFRSIEINSSNNILNKKEDNNDIFINTNSNHENEEDEYDENNKNNKLGNNKLYKNLYQNSNGNFNYNFTYSNDPSNDLSNTFTYKNKYLSSNNVCGKYKINKRRLNIKTESNQFDGDQKKNCENTNNLNRANVSKTENSDEKALECIKNHLNKGEGIDKIDNLKINHKIGETCENIIEESKDILSINNDINEQNISNNQLINDINNTNTKSKDKVISIKDNILNSNDSSNNLDNNYSNKNIENENKNIISENNNIKIEVNMESNINTSKETNINTNKEPNIIKDTNSNINNENIIDDKRNNEVNGDHKLSNDFKDNSLNKQVNIDSKIYSKTNTKIDEKTNKDATTNSNPNIKTNEFSTFNKEININESSQNCRIIKINNFKQRTNLSNLVESPFENKNLRRVNNKIKTEVNQEDEKDEQNISESKDNLNEESEINNIQKIYKSKYNTNNINTHNLIQNNKKENIKIIYKKDNSKSMLYNKINKMMEKNNFMEPNLNKKLKKYEGNEFNNDQTSDYDNIIDNIDDADSTLRSNDEIINMNDSSENEEEDKK